MTTVDRAPGPGADAGEANVSCGGFCRDCGREHALPHAGARDHARSMMDELCALGRLDHLAAPERADPALSFERVFAGEQGNMFGVLECRDADDRTVVLRAFSSLPWGSRAIPGWVPPLLSEQAFESVVAPGRAAIESMTDALERLAPGSARHRALAQQRRDASRALWSAMQELYALRNFRGELRRLREIVPPGQGIAGGTGECCAPRLLHYAAVHGLRPLGLAEFYWGGKRGGRGRVKGRFYPPCETRCRPLLGFLLCGVDE